ncbi:hypothetical protein ACSAZK_04290 [Methanosarcina sp. Mfa9]|uniref:hypothetical protein n=1 Tax=Methanosarcina sp. Mfa9 TaxID=3439063 RepID=UPI003F85EC39
MISAFHPSVLLCSPDNWKDEIFQDDFIQNLLQHLDLIKELKMNIAWCDEILNFLWSELPWREDYYNEDKLTEIFYEIANCNCTFMAPPDNECNTDPYFELSYSNEINQCWIVLIHRLLHEQKEVFVVTGLEIETEIDSIHVFCDCNPQSYENTYFVINHPFEWYKKIDYMKLCPTSLDNWDEFFLLTLKSCYEKEFSSRSLIIKLDDLEFSSGFKRTFKNIGDEKVKQRIIRTITQRLTYTNSEAGFHSGLRDEPIKGKVGERSIRISEGERIHYKKEEGKVLFLKYYSNSKHDIRGK